MLAAAIVGGFIAGIVLATRGTLTLPEPPVWVVVGLSLVWVGMALRLWASYLAVLILLFGLGLSLGDLGSVVVMVALPALGFAWRIRVEDAALRAGLGPSYDEYAAGRARLMPRIW